LGLSQAMSIARGSSTLVDAARSQVFHREQRACLGAFNHECERAAWMYPPVRALENVASQRTATAASGYFAPGGQGADRIGN